METNTNAIQNEAPLEIRSIVRTKVTELDVRPILEAGGEPFGAIMNAVASTASDGAIRLRATFKPTPLFHVLGQQGWQHWIERGEGADWIVWFYHPASGEAPAGVSEAEISAARLHKENPELGKRLQAEGNTWYLDVRRLSPPEPMELTLFVLENLPENTTLVQINERVPQFLLPILQERGFRYEVIQNAESDVLLEIARIS